MGRRRVRACLFSLSDARTGARFVCHRQGVKVCNCGGCHWVASPFSHGSAARAPPPPPRPPFLASALPEIFGTLLLLLTRSRGFRGLVFA
jgi:hypothetical protein